MLPGRSTSTIWPSARLEPTRVEAASAAWPGTSFAGTVETVDSRVDPVSRSVRVRARLPNTDGRLRPGMFLTVRVSREPRPGLVVPEQAVIPERGDLFVYVVAGGQGERRTPCIWLERYHRVVSGRSRDGEAAAPLVVRRRVSALAADRSARGCG